MIFAHKYHLKAEYSWQSLEMDVLSKDAICVIDVLEKEIDDFIINIEVQLISRDFEQVKDNFVYKVLDQPTH